ncbi:hypothetical protein NOR51B_1539 [Luminiphilus syltensis NOR5-1B]|uniref:S1/P1 Nuclease n=1 Tax=Luminiphilus syltensis NOR5-1B TaxID=565045 RepID=B8KWM0_9GAMM|nr:S1/P1 nuclease [Luminiphilus syltensis]EED35593.1 hypothetical protein NOR51B_1539 [Luminiphilus syltensis NOR5-1B]
MRAAPIILTLITALLTAPAQAWWDLGHAAICDAALEYVKPGTRLEIDRLLATRDNRGFGALCSWPDEIKTDQPTTAPWHYLNVPVGTTDIATAPRPAEGDILAVLTEQQARLSQANTDIHARAEALLWVAHLVGDLHQPLHVAYAEDRGGSSYRLQVPREIRALLGERYEETGMHQIWDGYLPLYARYSGGSGLKQLVIEQSAEAGGTPLEWAQESLTIMNNPGTAYLYGYRITILDEAYLAKNYRIALKRMKQAALRLAAVLDAALAPVD